ncbi:MAG TPA: hypothetical protein VE199_00420 [Nitrososphaera sp.]|nr:hypothetical protein [Nitrososphaera sp.]
MRPYCKKEHTIVSIKILRLTGSSFPLGRGIRLGTWKTYSRTIEVFKQEFDPESVLAAMSIFLPT